MSLYGDITMDSTMSYSFNAPNVTITVKKLANNSKYKSGSLKVELYNAQFSGPNYYGKSKLIASFKLDPLQGKYQYQSVTRQCQMFADVDLPYMVMGVSEYDGQYKLSHLRPFSGTIKPIQKDGYKNIKKGAGIAASVVGKAGFAVAQIGGRSGNPVVVAIGGVVGVVGNIIGYILDD